MQGVYFRTASRFGTTNFRPTHFDQYLVFRSSTLKVQDGLNQCTAAFRTLMWQWGSVSQTRVKCPSAQAMPLRKLGCSDLQVPCVSYGTMLFGERIGSYEEAAALMNMCVEYGSNLFDSAEMYPVPQQAHTQGRSEEMLGRWMRERGNRSKVLVSTKVAGPSAQMTWIRGGPIKLDSQNISDAIDGSLQRLGTDYIDMYQLHWPDRYVPMFGDTDFDPCLDYGDMVSIEEQLEALGRAVRAGKIRHIGLSNETPWGVMRFLAAGQGGSSLPRVTFLQNAYSLTCRTFDAALAEICHREDVGLLAYSPLAMGLLTHTCTAYAVDCMDGCSSNELRLDLGKYLSEDGGPPEARLNLYRGRYGEAESRYGRRPPVVRATAEYSRIAREAGLPPVELALRFVLQHPLVCSTIVGATNTSQLETLLRISAECIPLEVTLMEAIEAVHAESPDPTP